MRKLQITTALTTAEENSTGFYLDELAKIPLISAKEEVRLARSIREGDRAALHRLCTANLRFVVSIAKKYQHQGLPLADLIAEGNLGLIKAAERFDDTRGFKFISFAVWWVRQSILAALMEHARMIRVPVNKIEEIGLVRKTVALLEQQEGISPGSARIAEHLGMSEEQVKEVLWVAPRTASYDETGPDPLRDFNVLDRLTDQLYPTDQLVEAADRERELSFLLGRLGGKERLVIELSFGLGGERELAYTDIAPIIGLTPQATRHIALKALRKMREGAGEIT